MLSYTEREDIVKRHASLYAESSSFRTRWKDIQTYLMPGSGFFDDYTPGQAIAVDAQTILDSSPSLALRTLAAGLSSGMTPPSRPWVRFGLPDPDLEKFRPSRLWLQGLEDRFYASMAKSNIYGCMDNLYYECPGFGQGAMIVEKDFNSVMRGRVFTAGEYFYGLGPTGKVDSFGRRFWMTAGQLRQEFGLESLSNETKDLLKDANGTDKWVKVCHLIEPNPKQKVGLLAAANKAYRSVYWEDGRIERSLLRESGYDQFPVMVPRWKTRDSMAIYGISPAWEMLGDIKMLQELHRKKLLAIDKIIDPPVQIEDNGFDSDPALLPGEVIRYTGNNPNGGARSVYDVRIDLTAVTNEIAQVSQRIDRGFFRDLLMMVSQVQTQGKTAYEISKMYEEKLMVLGPVLESFKDELHDPLVDRWFEIALAAGIIPPPPAELQGMELKVEYISTLAQAQKMIGTAAIQEFYGMHVNICQLYPEARDNVDPDKLESTLHAKMGVPVEVMRDEEEVAAIREGRQQAEEKAAQEQEAAQGLENARSLSDTKVGQGNALDVMLQGMGAAPATAGPRAA